MPIPLLPLELVGEIFAFAASNSPSQRAQLTLVCKSWLEIGRKALYSTLLLDWSRSLEATETMIEALRANPYLSSLVRLFLVPQRLRRIADPASSEEADLDRAADALEICPEVREAVFFHLATDRLVHIASKLRELRSCMLNLTDGLSEDVVRAFVTGFPCLQVLSLHILDNSLDGFDTSRLRDVPQIRSPVVGLILRLYAREDGAGEFHGNNLGAFFESAIEPSTVRNVILGGRASESLLRWLSSLPRLRILVINVETEHSVTILEHLVTLLPQLEELHTLTLEPDPVYADRNRSTPIATVSIPNLLAACAASSLCNVTITSLVFAAPTNLPKRCGWQTERKRELDDQLVVKVYLDDGRTISRRTFVRAKTEWFLQDRDEGQILYEEKEDRPQE